MAQLKKTVLGKVSGAVGDVLFRQRNGKNIVGTRPSSFTPGSDPASVARRNRFGLSISFAKTMNSIPLLKSVWKSTTPAGLSPYNFMIKTNYVSIAPDNISGNAVLVPGFGFGVTPSAVSIDSSGIQADINPIGNSAGIDTAIEQSILLVSVIYMNNPVDNTVKQNGFLSFVSDSQTLSLSNPLSFQVSLSNQETQLFDKYQAHKGFFTLLTLNADGNAVQYSGTFTG